VANEGRLICFVPASEADHALALLRKNPLGADSCIIGSVGGEGRGRVTMKSRIGSNRILDMLSGELLPRIC